MTDLGAVSGLSNRHPVTVGVQLALPNHTVPHATL